MDIDSAIKFMESINYYTLFNINDICTVYANDDIELVVQRVNGKYIFIEMEDKAEFINRKFNSIEEMVKSINKYDIPFERDNYFVKKAEIMLDETLK